METLRRFRQLAARDSQSHNADAVPKKRSFVTMLTQILDVSEMNAQSKPACFVDALGFSCRAASREHGTTMSSVVGTRRCRCRRAPRERICHQMPSFHPAGRAL